jgi:hypothetical protein
MKKEVLHIGDEVVWHAPPYALSTRPVRAKVKHIQLCEREHDRSGVLVPEVKWDWVNRCVIDLDNGHWTYGTGVTPC